MEGSSKVGHIYNKDLGTKLGKSVHNFEAEIIKGINTLGGSVSHNELMRYLVEDQSVMGKPTFGKYTKRMTKERKLIRTQDTESNNVFYQVAPAFWQDILPSDEEELLEIIREIEKFMISIENTFAKLTLLDKVLMSVNFYQTLQRIRTWHELIYLIETTMEPDKPELNYVQKAFHEKQKLKNYMSNTIHLDSLPPYFNPVSFLPIRDVLYGLIANLFELISKDADAKTIHYLIQLKAVFLPEVPLDIPFIRKYNSHVTKLEKNVKKDPPIIWTDANGKQATSTLSLKKIPLPKNKPKKLKTKSLLIYDDNYKKE